MAVVRIRTARTEDSRDFKEASLSDASRLYVKRASPYDDGNGQPKDAASEFDVDLRVGQAWARDWRGEKPQYFAVPSGGIVIPPGGTVIVEVDEEIRVPSNRLGIVFPKARLGFRTGLHPLTTKVDPTYSGYLKVFLHNFTQETRKLKRGDAVASLVFVATNHSVDVDRPYDPPARAEESRRLVGARIHFLLGHPTAAATIGSTFGALLTIAVTSWLV